MNYRNHILERIKPKQNDTIVNVINVNNNFTNNIVNNFHTISQDGTNEHFTFENRNHPMNSSGNVKLKNPQLSSHNVMRKVPLPLSTRHTPHTINRPDEKLPTSFREIHQVFSTRVKSTGRSNAREPSK
jgi:hypothetical protein